MTEGSKAPQELDLVRIEWERGAKKIVMVRGAEKGEPATVELRDEKSGVTTGSTTCRTISDTMCAVSALQTEYVSEIRAAGFGFAIHHSAVWEKLMNQKIESSYPQDV